MWKLKHTNEIASHGAFLGILDLNEMSWRQLQETLPHRYRRVLIPKRRGGHRQLLVPDCELMDLQRLLLKALYRTLVIPKHLTGGVPGGSIRKHAEPHVKKLWVATFDIRDFFGTVCPKALVQVLLRLGFQTEVARDIVAIGFVAGQLPQGAPTSAFLANLALLQLDKNLLRLAKRHDLIYTRYLDDMAFSGPHDFRQLRGPISQHTLANGFELRHDKEEFMGPGHRQIVTGLVVNKKLRPTAEFYLRLKEDLKALTLIDTLAHRRRVTGRLAYLNQF